jgi:flagellar FliL protein
VRARGAAPPAGGGHDAPAGHTPTEHGGGKRRADVHKGVLYRIDNVIVNPAGSRGSRFLMTSVAFELPDAEAEERLRAREVEVRDVVIATLESQTLEMLSRPGARDTLKLRLRDAVAPILGEAREVRVYLPQFVMQ